MQVYVRDNDINAALRILKRKMQREGTFRSACSEFSIST
jgi:small subunit ribosomal protein S21